MPYISDTLLLNGLKGYKNDFTISDLYIPLAKYRSNPSSIIVGIKLFFGMKISNDDLYVRGYQARPRIWGNDFEKFIKSKKTFNIHVTPQLIQEFKDLILFCKKNKIKLYFIYAPEYIKVQPYYINRPSIFNYYKTASTLYKIPFIDYSNDTISYNTKYFYNSEHLNKIGSETFTKKLANDIAAEENKTVHPSNPTSNKKAGF